MTKCVILIYLFILCLSFQGEVDGQCIPGRLINYIWIRNSFTQQPCFNFLNASVPTSSGFFVSVPNYGITNPPSAGAFWFNQLRPYREGFQLSFGFQVSGPDPGFSSGTGFLFGIHSSSTTFLPHTGFGTDDYGFKPLQSGFGIAFNYTAPSQFVHVDLIVTDDKLQYDPHISWRLNFTVEDTNRHTAHIVYTKQFEEPYIIVYVDNQLVGAAQIDLDPILEPQSYSGFASSWTSNSKQNNSIIVKFDSFLDKDLWALNWYFDAETAHYYSPILTYVSPLNEFFLPDKPVMFPVSQRASLSSPGSIYKLRGSSAASSATHWFAGMLFELINDNGDVINLRGSIRCSDDPEGTWTDDEFDDSNWEEPTYLGIKNELVPPAPYRHIPKFSKDAEYFWASNLSTPDYACRIKVPRWCSQADRTWCVGNEDCIDNLCSCQPPFGGVNCMGYQIPVITRLTPSIASPGAQITVEGNLFFNSSEIRCVFNSSILVPAIFIEENVIVCDVPSELSTGVQTIAVQNVDSIDSRSDNEDIYLYGLFTATDISPSVVDVRVPFNVNIIGNGYDPLLNYSCFLDGEQSEATYLSSSSIRCSFSGRAAGAYFIEITVNGIDFILTDQPIIINNTGIAPYCRAWYKGRLQEYPFVATNFGHRFYPNLAVGQEITQVTRNGITVSENDLFTTTGVANFTQLVDEDFCCAPQIGNDAFKCGLLFRKDDSATITIKLRETAVTNQFVIAWWNSCSNMPTSYNIYYRNDTTSTWQQIVNRITSGDTECNLVPSDRGSVALCINYFIDENNRNITAEADTFMIEFFNTSSDGAWLYEIGVRGQYISDPYALVVTRQFPATIGANNFVQLPEIELSLITIKNEPTDATPGLMLTITLERIVNNQPTLRNDLLIADTLTKPWGSGIFNDLSMVATELGQYRLNFSATNLITASIYFTITPGAAVELRITQQPAVALVADANALVPPFTVCWYDVLGNAASQPILLSISIDRQSQLRPSGSLTRNITNSCITINDFRCTPLVGSYMFTISSEGLSSASFNLDVTVGFPRRMAYGVNESFTIDNRGVVTPPIRIRVVDGAENIIGASESFAFYNMRLDRFEPDTAIRGSGDIVTILNGEAVFTLLRFRGIHGTTYNLIFMIQPMSTVQPLAVPVKVLTCSEVDSSSEPIAPGYSCQCRAGFEPIEIDNNSTAANSTTVSCSPCEINFFKPEPGTSRCEPCGFGRDTFFRKGSARCVCDQQRMRNEQTEECMPCPSGARCGDDRILGNELGFWSSGSGRFHPCYKIKNPSRNDLEAAQEACPAADNSVTTCGAGYTGPRCLLCDAGFGTSGPFCRECPKTGLNFTVVIICIAVVIAMMTFLVVQGSTPKNKESVSIKILLNHIQMLALLGTIGAVWTEPFFGLLIASGTATIIDQRVVSWDCAFKVSYFTKYAFFLLLPWITLAACGLIFGLLWLWKSIIKPLIPRFKEAITIEEIKQTGRQILAQFILGVAVITFVTYPTVCIKVLEPYDCSVEVDGKAYMNAAPEIQCATAEHAPFILWSTIMLIVYCIGLPVVAFILLTKYRKSPSMNIHLVLRFFYDGFKYNRYYWELIIILRKFLIVMFIIIFRNNLLHQIYGMTFVVQAAVILHIILHPYTSGRQYRLELWSLMGILVTLFLSLYIIEGINDGEGAVALSALVLVLHIIIFLAFMFFITRGLMRRFMKNTWAMLRSMWKRQAPEKLVRDTPKYTKVKGFFELFGNAAESEREKMYTSLQNWWKSAPNYKRRRFLRVLQTITDGSAFEGFASRAIENEVELSVLPKL